MPMSHATFNTTNHSQSSDSDETHHANQRLMRETARVIAVHMQTPFEAVDIETFNRHVNAVLLFSIDPTGNKHQRIKSLVRRLAQYQSSTNYLASTQATDDLNALPKPLIDSIQKIQWRYEDAIKFVLDTKRAYSHHKIDSKIIPLHSIEKMADEAKTVCIDMVIDAIIDHYSQAGGERCIITKRPAVSMFIDPVDEDVDGLISSVNKPEFSAQNLALLLAKCQARPFDRILPHEHARLINAYFLRRYHQAKSSGGVLTLSSELTSPPASKNMSYSYDSLDSLYETLSVLSLVCTHYLGLSSFIKQAQINAINSEISTNRYESGRFFELADGVRLSLIKNRADIVMPVTLFDAINAFRDNNL